MCEGGEREFGQHENCSMKKWKNWGGFENYVRIIIERSRERKRNSTFIKPWKMRLILKLMRENSRDAEKGSNEIVTC